MGFMVNKKAIRVGVLILDLIAFLTYAVFFKTQKMPALPIT